MTSVPKRPADEMLALRRAAWHRTWDRLLAEPRPRDTERQAAAPSTEEPKPAPKARTRKPSPSRLAKWEAAWQAEHDAEAES